MNKGKYIMYLFSLLQFIHIQKLPKMLVASQGFDLETTFHISMGLVVLIYRSSGAGTAWLVQWLVKGWMTKRGCSWSPGRVKNILFSLHLDQF
jgi:hypothetical protein